MGQIPAHERQPGHGDVHPEVLTGPALDVARRVAAAAKGGDVIVSATVRDLVAGSGIEFAPRGGLAPGKAAERRPLFAVVSPATAVRAAGTVVRLTSP